ncbi:hypothetical protein ACA910_002816 [Epithemia clementina (nom. ined.)]
MAHTPRNVSSIRRDISISTASKCQTRCIVWEDRRCPAQAWNVIGHCRCVWNLSTPNLLNWMLLHTRRQDQVRFAWLLRAGCRY